MKVRFLVKGSKDKKIPKKCCDGEEMLTAEKEIDCCWIPTTQVGEHGNNSCASVYVPPSVKFVVAIMVQLLKRFSSFRYGFLELLATRTNTSSQ